MARAALAVSTLAVLLLPRVVEACAVCTAGRDDENKTAFLISTIFLSLLPLAGIGTLVFVIRRRLRRLELEAATATASGAGAFESGRGPDLPTDLGRGLPAGVGALDA